ncbi:MAG: hypothetical protein JOY71_25530 [Acetobacteraceae bacterium]|nr:hypothetical protein [Acetobacteraceae bacterium]
MAELAFTPAAELADMIRRRVVSPVEVARDALERIERSQPVLKPFITVTADRAMDPA